MAKNDNLHKAKDAKNDEFYTRIEDVAEELRHYKKHFAGKVVLCNCDDPTWSAFWRYFHLNFAELGLKKLISTHYDRTEPTYKMEYEGGDDNNVEVGVKTPLEGNGDFRNAECIKLLDECVIVVTNPPWSMFREYIALLVEHKKQFVIIGNKNAITYKEFFPLLKGNHVWIGYMFPSEFDTPSGMTKKVTASIGIPVEADDDAVNEAMNSDELIAYAVGVLYDLAAYMRPQWLDGEDTDMTLEVYFGDSICQTRNGFVTMDKKGYSFDLED